MFQKVTCFVLIAALTPVSTWARSPEENLAHGKSYEIAPRPNYPGSRGGEDTDLTDGVVTPEGERAWVDPSGVTWESKIDPINVTIDLEHPSQITGASIRADGGRAGVGFPFSVAMLVSHDGKQFDFVADLVGETIHELPDPNVQGVTRFEVKNLGVSGRYVRLMIVTSTKFLSIDEVEVFGHALDAEAKKPDTPIRAAAWATNPQRLFDLGQTQRLRRDFSEVSHLVHERGAAAEIKQRLAEVGSALEAFVPTGDATGFRAIIPFNEMHRDIFQVYAHVLRSKGVAPLTVWTSPAYKLMPLFVVPDGGAASLRVTQMNNERRATVINVTNADDQAKSIRLQIDGLPAGPNPPYISAYEVVFVDTRPGRPVGTALLPMRTVDDGFEFTVEPGMTSQIWLSSRPQNLEEGTHAGVVALRGTDGSVIADVPLTLDILPYRMPSRFALRTTMWDYIFAEAYASSKSNKLILRDFVVDEGFLNVPVGNQPDLPGDDEDVFDVVGQLTGEIDFTRWDAFVDFWSDLEEPTYSVFGRWERKRDFAGFDFGTPGAHRALSEWAARWAERNRELGLAPKQTMAYFIDEPRSDAEYQKIESIHNAIRSGTQEIKMFSNPLLVDLKTPIDAIDSLYSEHDIISPTPEHYERLKPDVKARLQTYIEDGGELWLYSCKLQVLHRDPSYYRMQPWYCLKLGAVGQGFWALADTSLENNWNPYIGVTGRNFCSPLFIDDQSVTQTKHWAAIRDGVYDYQYVHLLDELADRLEQSGHAREASEIRSSLEDLPGKVLQQLQQREGLPAYRGGLMEWNNQSQVAEDARAEMIQLFKRYVKLDSPRTDTSH